MIIAISKLMSLQLKTVPILAFTTLESRLDKVPMLWLKNAFTDRQGNVSQSNNTTDANLLTNSGESK